MLIRLALALAALALGGAAAAETPLRVMTFNVRLPLASDAPNDWPRRRALAAEVVRDADPDVIGTQELFREQGRDLVERLPAFAWIGAGRRGGRDDEHMGLFYRRDRLRLVRFGDFWLSDTPDAPGSISWGNLYPRMTTWAVFERFADGRRFAVFNTHLPYRPEDAEARRRGAALVAERIVGIAPGLPVILTGDFNETPDGAAHALLSARLDDAWTGAARRAGPAETFHGFTGRADRRIDWIFERGFTVRRAWTIATGRDGRWPSDHFPVVAELRFDR